MTRVNKRAVVIRPCRWQCLTEACVFDVIVRKFGPLVGRGPFCFISFLRFLLLILWGKHCVCAIVLYEISKYA